MNVLINDDTAVFLAKDGDHIVTRFTTDKAGFQHDRMVAADTPVWDVAVQRAMIGGTFL